ALKKVRTSWKSAARRPVPRRGDHEEDAASSFARNSGYHHHQGVYHWSADHASHHHRIGAVFLESSSGIHAPCGWRGGHSGSHLRGSGGRRKIPLPRGFCPAPSSGHGIGGEEPPCIRSSPGFAEW